MRMPFYGVSKSRLEPAGFGVGVGVGMDTD